MSVTQTQVDREQPNVVTARSTSVRGVNKFGELIDIRWQNLKKRFLESGFASDEVPGLRRRGSVGYVYLSSDHSFFVEEEHAFADVHDVQPLWSSSGNK